jgi:hypothetical protein
MRGKGSGFGLIMLLVVLAVILILVGRSWNSVAPEALSVADHGQPEAAEAVRSGKLPDLKETRQRTEAHAQEVREILEETE